jgi:hypothetical protein
MTEAGGFTGQKRHDQRRVGELHDRKAPRPSELGQPLEPVPELESDPLRGCRRFRWAFGLGPSDASDSQAWQDRLFKGYPPEANRPRLRLASRAAQYE